MICKKCGKDVQGILEWSVHPCAGETFEYRVYTDNEMRIALMELGLPDMAFETMNLAVPTEMERIIYKKQ